ncbi:MAG: anthranilate phosphoribosyltransferase [Gemmatimonadota bacterium]|nr:anthranilate phosphoribosyltransferase [Gemmatimonadota bacterium]
MRDLPAQEFAFFLESIADRRDLSPDEAEAAFDRIMSGSVSEAETAALLMGLGAKGVAPSEVAGGVRALRKAMVPVHGGEAATLVDTAGTGGGSLTTFNISTAAALVAAGAGARVAKHGNRSFTSRSGSADVLEALGVRIDLSPERMSEVLHDVGIVFMFAPLLHPAMRHVASVRRALGIPTIMNLLGPLTNPAGATRQVVGVSDPRLIPLLSGALAELGHRSALVVHGEPGVDEVSPMGATRVAELGEGGVREYEVTPESVGLERGGPGGLEGGEPADNARVIEGVLAGVEGSARTAVVLNAAAALLAAGLVTDWNEGVRVAEASIDEGRARASLERLRDATAG